MFRESKRTILVNHWNFNMQKCDDIYRKKETYILQSVWSNIIVLKEFLDIFTSDHYYLKLFHQVDTHLQHIVSTYQVNNVNDNVKRLLFVCNNHCRKCRHNSILYEVYFYYDVQNFNRATGFSINMTILFLLKTIILSTQINITVITYYKKLFYKLFC